MSSGSVSSRLAATVTWATAWVSSSPAMVPAKERRYWSAHDPARLMGSPMIDWSMPSGPMASTAIRSSSRSDSLVKALRIPCSGAGLPSTAMAKPR